MCRIPADKIDLPRSTTANNPKFLGTGTFGSRSLISHGGATCSTAAKSSRKGNKLAANEFEVSAVDVAFDNGAYTVVAFDLKITLQALIDQEVARPQHPLDTNTTIDRQRFSERRCHHAPGRDRSRYRRT